jgi:membrane fusion protein, multidrug efflux system
MAEPRSIVTLVSIALAIGCAGWAIYASKHEPVPAGGGFAGGGGGGPGGAQRAQAPIQVITAAAEEREIDVGLEAIGTAVSNESVEITSKTTNIVTAIRFRDGESVRAGQVLVELDRETAVADLAAATAAFEESRSQFNRSRELLAAQVVSKAQGEQLEATMKSNEARVAAAQARVSDTYIRAPFNGRVGLRRVSLGALISPGTLITTLDDISLIKVDFAVPEANVGTLRAGQTVSAVTTAYPGRAFEGKVLSSDSRVDPATRSVVVRASLANREGALKPGMFLTVKLSQDRRTALMIREEALVPEQARQFVYVIQGQTVAKREVTLGRREPGLVEITNGLVAGDRVVVEGTLKLRDGAPVREIGAVDPDAPSLSTSPPSGTAPAPEVPPARETAPVPESSPVPSVPPVSSAASGAAGKQPT